LQNGKESALLADYFCDSPEKQGGFLKKVDMAKLRWELYSKKNFLIGV